MMNRLISIRVLADVTYRRVCAILMLALLMGFSLVIGGTVVDSVLIRNVGLGLFLLAAFSLLAIVLLAHHSEHRPLGVSFSRRDSYAQIQD
jgi:hypothetical protein